MDVTGLLGLLEPASVAILLIVVGLLSKRLGEQTSSRPYYLGFYTAAVLLLISAAAGFLDVLDPRIFSLDETIRVLLEDGLPALAVSLGVYAAWRYWSWLLAERD